MVSPAKWNKNIVQTINDENFIASPPSLTQTLNDSSYHTRAWTFQKCCISQSLRFTLITMKLCEKKLWKKVSNDISNVNRIFINPLMMHFDRCKITPGLAPSPRAVLTPIKHWLKNTKLENYHIQKKCNFMRLLKSKTLYLIFCQDLCLP